MGVSVSQRGVSASFDGTARLWEAETAKCVKKFPRRKQPVYAIEFSPDGAYCVIGSFDRTVEVRQRVGMCRSFAVTDPRCSLRAGVSCRDGQVRSDVHGARGCF